MDEKKLFMIIPTGSINQIDFEQVNEIDVSGLETIHFGQKTYVSWNGMTPDSIQNISDSEGPFNEEIFPSIIQEQNTEHSQSIE